MLSTVVGILTDVTELKINAAALILLTPSGISARPEQFQSLVKIKLEISNRPYVPSAPPPSPSSQKTDPVPVLGLYGDGFALAGLIPRPEKIKTRELTATTDLRILFNFSD